MNATNNCENLWVCSAHQYINRCFKTIITSGKVPTFLYTASILAIYCFTLYQLRDFPTRPLPRQSRVSCVLFLFISLTIFVFFIFIPIDFIVFYYVSL